MAHFKFARNGKIEEAFITPILTKGENPKTAVMASPVASRFLAYIIEAMLDNSYGNKTLVTAAKEMAEKFPTTGKPEDVFVYWVPTKVEDRDSTDLSKWSKVHVTTRGEISAEIRRILEADRVHNEMKPGKVTASHPLPNYNDDSAVTLPVKGKRSGGKNLDI